MPNDTLKQLLKTTSSDKYDRESYKLIEKLQAKWDLAEASENLSQHIVIKALIEDLEQEVIKIGDQLRDQVIKNDTDIRYRYKLQADRASYQKFLDIFNGRDKEVLIQRIDALKAKADLNQL